MSRHANCLIRVSGAVFALIASEAAYAYIGPGAGLGAIGTLIAFVGALLLAIVGFIWYPIKRLLKKKKQPEVEKPAGAQSRGQDGESKVK